MLHGFCSRSASLYVDILKQASTALAGNNQRAVARLENYAWSFSWGFRGIDGPGDRAALISAIGWCSGWSSLGALGPLGHLSSPSRVGRIG